MGAMKDLHIETLNLAGDWAALLAAVLEQGGAYRVTIHERDQPSDEEEWEMMRFVPDLSFSAEGSERRTAVEIKTLRWRGDWQLFAKQALEHMLEVIARGTFDRGLLVLTLDLEASETAAIRAAAGEAVDVWDLNALRHEIGDQPALQDALAELAAQTLMDRPRASLQPATPPVARGISLARRLRAVPSGVEGWQAFENICEEAIRHLFGRELHNLTRQQRSDDGLNRMDLIGRIRAEESSFWSLLAMDFRTRYVVFDAKNSAHPIAQQDVQITEKCLIRKGLRNVAIIIAREGSSPSAHNQASAVLREHGTLILIVSREELGSMLERSDRGDPPENVLFDKLDAMLMALSR